MSSKTTPEAVGIVASGEHKGAIVLAPHATVAKEIERKFLLFNIPEDTLAMWDREGSQVCDKQEITQIYLVSEGEGSVRIRRKENIYHTKYILTVKIGSIPLEYWNSTCFERDEIEQDVQPQIFDAAARLNLPTITKTRYVQECTNAKEVCYDVFHGDLEGLIMSEIEFDSVSQAEDYEPTFADIPFIEVTDNEHFSNAYLSKVKNPLPLIMEAIKSARNRITWNSSKDLASRSK